MSDLDDVIAMCDLSHCYPARTVWTYFVQSVEGGPIKIGFTSKEPEERLMALQTGSPTRLRIVGLIPLNREKELHVRFAENRSHGEWFDASDALVSFIGDEASVHLQNRLVIQANLDLDSTIVAVSTVSRPEVRASYFESVLDNNDTLLSDFFDHCDWDEGELWDGEGEPEEADLVSNYIADMAIVCQSAGTFVESVGINADASTVGFICGPCNSRRRFELLKDLGDLAIDIDCITGRWFFFAVLWEAGRQICINLRMLALTNGKENCHIFYPADLLSSGQPQLNLRCAD